MCNVSSKERVIRYILGIIVLGSGPVVGSWTVGILGALLIATSVFRFCPIYLLTGINTCKTKE